MLFLQLPFPTGPAPFPSPPSSFSLSKPKGISPIVLALSWKPVSPRLQVGLTGSVSWGHELIRHDCGLLLCSSWSELPVLYTESAEHLPNGSSSEPCFLEETPSLDMKRWFGHSEWSCLHFLSPRSMDGRVPIALVLCVCWMNE